VLQDAASLTKALIAALTAAASAISRGSVRLMLRTDPAIVICACATDADAIRAYNKRINVFMAVNG
jgi:hypothetical protein